jgi:hypothetical protein
VNSAIMSGFFGKVVEGGPMAVCSPRLPRVFNL